MKRLLICILFAVSAFGLKCANSSNTKDTIIIGDLKGLPDGTMLLIGTTFDRKNINIDSTITKDGHFNFVIGKKNLPHLLTLEHYDQKGVKRVFSFKTNINEGLSNSQYFMPDDSVLINGNLVDVTNKSLKLPPNLILVTPDQQIKSGRQTYVMYNVNYDFNQPITHSSMNALSNLIRQYSYSYYLINEINDHRNRFTNNQLNTLLLLFDKEVQQSDIAGSLKKSIQFKNTKSFNTVSFLNKDYETIRLDIKNTKITMVVLWASWCAPCRMEIPILKELYDQFSSNPDFKMISISLDRKKEDWQEALKIEKMPWQQLLVPDDLQTYSNEIFKFNGSIPTTIFINNSGTEIIKFTGYDKNSLENYEKIISDNLNK